MPTQQPRGSDALLDNGGEPSGSQSDTTKHDRRSRNLSLLEKVLTVVTAALTLGVAILGIRNSTVSGENDGLQGTVDSLKRQNSTLTQENEQLRRELETLTADRDRWKKAAEAAPTPGVGTTSTPTPYDYEFEFADKTYYDFDTRKADTSGGAQYEVELDFGRFFHGVTYNTWKDARVVYIKDSAVSYSGCENGTDIQAGEVAQLNKVEQDESICVRTNGQKWAALKVLAAQPSGSGLGTGNISFGVRLLAK